MKFDEVDTEDPAELDHRRGYLIDRRRLLKSGGFELGFLAVGGLLSTPLGSAVAAIPRRPMVADASLEIQIFQTAASLEILAVATYAGALEQPFVQQNAAIKQFAETTMQQHVEHAAAFNAQAEALGGVRQDAPHPRFAQLVEQTQPTLTDVDAVVRLAATLEEVATDTYLANVIQLGDATMRTLMASVMGVEAQHLATLRTVDALFSAALPDLVANPLDVHRLPAAIGSVACPNPFEAPNLASGPAEGAVR